MPQQPAEVSVLIVAERADEHAAVVASMLEEAGVSHMQFAMNDLAHTAMHWTSRPSLSLGTHERGVRIGQGTTVWWRRPGQPEPPDLDPEEAALFIDETWAAVPAALVAVGVRWVDAPEVQWASGRKLVQLATAGRLGIHVPPTIVTSNEIEAREWAASMGVPIVAKAMSSGFGIAPYADVVPLAELDRINACPTMLQELVKAEFDLRVVTIGDRAFTWSRKRDHTGPVDWRRIDPGGSGFSPTDRPDVEAPALALAAELGLTFSAQDWLSSRGDPTFLEINPQGQWLFLEGAAERVGRPLARHLSADGQGVLA